MATAQPKSSSAAPVISGFGRALIQNQRVPEAVCVEAMQAAAGNNNQFILELVKQKAGTALEFAEFASETFGYPLLDVSRYDGAAVAKDAIDAKLREKHQVVPLLCRQNRVTLAIADPSNLRVVDEVRFQTGLQVDLVVAEADKIERYLQQLASGTVADTLKELTDESADPVHMEAGEDDGVPVDDDASIEDAPVVRFIQKVLIDAINHGSSDIHFEPYEKFYRIRTRTDGQLREISKVPLNLKEKISARLKVVSRLDIAERRIPQDGRMKLVLSRSKAIDFRVSTLPTLHGEKIVLRILDPSSAMLGIDALGYEPDQRKALLHAIQRPYGMVLVTGPTGSGKTVSLYTCLNILNTEDVNISTAEDPAEINLPGINQVNMNDKAGLTFAAALRSFLRQDPDIIMVGEIRDLETAEIAVKAAQTGHMVLSTLHTNDAPTTLERLRNMGVAPFNIASSVILITAQRLARRLCSCKQKVSVPREALLEAGFTEEDLADTSWTLYGPKGCDRCNGSGYKGRVGIYQVMPVTEEMTRIIMSGGNSNDVADQAQKEGVRDLRQSGLLKVKQGVTSLAEVLACTNE